jgi:hypothetical protein
VGHRDEPHLQTSNLYVQESNLQRQNVV